MDQLILKTLKQYIKNKIDNSSGLVTVETDPTVHSWAKASSKPTYTAAEVGAWSSSTAIPSKLSDLTNDSFYMEYVTTAPTADNVGNYKIAILSEEPTTKYNGWLYLTTTKEEEPLFLQAVNDNTFVGLSVLGSPEWTGSYKINDGEWITYDISNAPDIILNKDDKAYFKGTVAYMDDYAPDCLTFIAQDSNSGESTSVNVGGNIMSYVQEEDWQTATEISDYAACCYLFKGLEIENLTLKLPATTLSESCYMSMFEDCTSLTTAPELPATILADYCYENMFYGCTSLTTAPVLPVTTLTTGCYYGMFDQCTSLTTAPELPATTLESLCYVYMFSGCTSLTTAPELPATILADYCYENMFWGCTSLTTAPVLPVTTLTTGCYYGMFQRCTSLTTAPELPATTLADLCYYAMFDQCTSLTTAPELPATTLADWCYEIMFNGCKSLISIPELPAIALKFSCYKDMFNGCKSIKLSTTQTSDYTKKYIIPIEGEGIIGSNSLVNMFINTGGTFTGTPEINTTYYLHKSCKIIPEKEEVQYLHFVAEEANSTITLSINNIEYTESKWEGSYSLDGNTWLTYPITEENHTITLSNVGDTIYFKGILSDEYIIDDYEDPWDNLYFSMTGKIAAYGNIMSLYCEDNFATTTTLSYPYMCSHLFSACSSLTRAPLLPATTLTDYCYSSMFSNCASLTTAPQLPATTLTNNCYEFMFMGCSSLQSTPTLPATNLAEYCYGQMFKECTSLTTLTALPAKTLYNACYYGMFYNCTSLTSIVKFPHLENLEWTCLSSMFYNCASIKISETQNEEYTQEYKIIVDNDYDEWDMNGIFRGTGGPFTGIPENGVTYYVHKDCTIVDCGEDDPQYLCFTAKEANSTIVLYAEGDASWEGSYSTDLSTWIEYIPSSTGAITLANVGDKVYFKGIYNADNWANYDYLEYSMTGKIAASGNIMSFCCGDDFKDITTIPIEAAFTSLFYGCESLITAPELPATILSPSCYQSMFEDCTSLTTAPKLPATISTSNCYYSMFSGCTSLTTAPELPSTTTSSECYSHMFYGCTSLTVAPELPATAAEYGCYNSMFKNCTSLETAPDLPATTIKAQCYQFMFSGCTSLITAPELPATVLDWHCYEDMFYGCTSLTTAPALPATTLTWNCYTSMFCGCESLNTPPELPATTLATECYQSMFKNCTELTSAPELPATTAFSSCYEEMFANCPSLETAPALPATTLAWGCYSGMFKDCISLLKIPALPATTLSKKCYYQMFKGCTSVQIYEWQIGSYTKLYKIPIDGDGTTETDALTEMFTNTGGDFKSTPTINKAYYLHSSCDIIYPPVAVTSVTLSEHILSLYQAETKQITYTISPENATNKNITWSSNNSGVIITDGVISIAPTATGSAIITITTQDGNKTDTCTITIVPETYDYIFQAESLSGTATQGEDTNLTLFDDEHTNWTLLSYAAKATNTGQTDTNATLYQIVVNASPWAGLRVDADNGNYPLSTATYSPLLPRFYAGGDWYLNPSTGEATSSKPNVDPSSTMHPVCISRDGNVYKYSIDGLTWTEFANLTTAQLNRLKTCKLTVGFDYRRSSGEITTNKYRKLITDSPCCVAIKYESEYPFWKLYNQYDDTRELGTVVE